MIALNIQCIGHFRRVRKRRWVEKNNIEITLNFKPFWAFQQFYGIGTNETVIITFRKVIDGVIFLASCICDLELQTVEWTRQWIAEVGEQLL